MKQPTLKIIILALTLGAAYQATHAMLKDVAIRYFGIQKTTPPKNHPPFQLPPDIQTDVQKKQPLPAQQPEKPTQQPAFAKLLGRNGRRAFTMLLSQYPQIYQYIPKFMR